MEQTDLLTAESIIRKGFWQSKTGMNVCFKPYQQLVLGENSEINVLDVSIRFNTSTTNG